MANFTLLHDLGTHADYSCNSCFHINRFMKSDSLFMCTKCGRQQDPNDPDALDWENEEWDDFVKDDDWDW